MHINELLFVRYWSDNQLVSVGPALHMLMVADQACCSTCTCRMWTHFSSVTCHPRFLPDVVPSCRMSEHSLEQILCEALRQYEKQIRPLVAEKQSRTERNRHVSAQVTKMVTERQKEWSALTSLNDLTRAVCSVLDDYDGGPFKTNFLKFAVEALERVPSTPSSESESTGDSVL